MTIEFACTNILEYDAEQQRYRQCGAHLSAEDHESGNRMKCSSCRQWVEIPVASTIRTDDAKTEQVQVVANSSELLDGEFSVMPETNQKQSGREQPMKAVPVEADRMSQFDDDFSQNAATWPTGASARLRFDAFDTTRLCPRCEGTLDKMGRCTTCKYGRSPVVLPKQVPLEHFATQTAGFSYWLHRWITPDITITQLVGAASALFGVCLLMYAIVAFVLGGPAVILMLAIVSPFVIAYIYVTQHWVRMNTRPLVKLQWWQQILWSWFLNYARSNNWSRPHDKVIDCRNQNLTDQQITTLPRLGKISVLDLEGNQLTDQGLLRLYEFTNIRCMVLRNTRVTPEGVFRLQQFNRRMWIWAD